MSEISIELNNNNENDLQYEKYNESMEKLALIGYAVLDSVAVISYELTKSHLSASMAKIALLTTTVGATPSLMYVLSDRFKSSKDN